MVSLKKKEGGKKMIQRQPTSWKTQKCDLYKTYLAYL